MVMPTALLSTSLGSRGRPLQPSGDRCIARRAAIALRSCAPQHALNVDGFVCIGLDGKQVQLHTDKIAETVREGGLALHPVTTASSKGTIEASLWMIKTRS